MWPACTAVRQPWGSGRRSERSASHRPSPLEVRVVCRGWTAKALFAVIRGTQQFISAFAPSMQPIMINTFGRSGGSLADEDARGASGPHRRAAISLRDAGVELLDAFRARASRTRGHLRGSTVLEGSESATSLPLLLQGPVQWADPKQSNQPSTAGTPPTRFRSTPAWRKPLSSRFMARTPTRETARHLPSSRRRSSRQATAVGRRGSFTRGRGRYSSSGIPGTPWPLCWRSMLGAALPASVASGLKRMNNTWPHPHVHAGICRNVEA